jgi:two-component sensor histidine kinase
MDADTSIQLGMITCELLANCHQHAFPYSTGGHIDLIVRDTGEGMFTMTVKDNGKGTTAAATNRAALGLEVVEALAEQLDGKMRMVEGEGTTVEVTFRSIGH